MDVKVNNDGYNMLARVIQERMKKVNHIPESLDFGEIKEDYALKTNKFPVPIPVSDYLVGRQLTLLPEAQKPKPGDHVLVAWLGADPVVIDLIRPATEVM